MKFYVINLSPWQNPSLGRTPLYFELIVLFMAVISYKFLLRVLFMAIIWIGGFILSVCCAKKK